MSTLARPAFSTAVRHTADGLPRFERRRDDRWSLDGIAIAHVNGGVAFGRRHVLRLLDGSVGGLGAKCATSIAPGTIVTVSFPAPGRPVIQATVLRCLPAGDGYRVAIGFDGLRAA